MTVDFYFGDIVLDAFVNITAYYTYQTSAPASGSISISSALPSNSYPLFANAVDLPPFCAWGTFTSAGTNPVQVYLELVDQNGNVVGISPTTGTPPPTYQPGTNKSWGVANCPGGQTNQWVYIPPQKMPQVTIPTGARYTDVLAPSPFLLKAVLTDSVTLQTVVTSATIPYNVELGENLTGQLELSAFPIIPTTTTGAPLPLPSIALDPKKDVFLTFNSYRSLEDAVSEELPGISPVPELDLNYTLDFAGSYGQLDMLVTQTDPNGKVITQSPTGHQLVTQGQQMQGKVYVHQSLAPSAATVTFTPRLTAANTQVVKYPGISFGVEAVTITQATPSDKCLTSLWTEAIGQNCPSLGQSNTFTFSGTVLASVSGEQLYSISQIDGSHTIVDQVRNLSITPGKPTPFTDSFTINIPNIAKAVTIAYILVRPGLTAQTCGIQCAIGGKTYKTLIPTDHIILASNQVNSTFALADGSLQLLGIQTSQQVQNAVTALNLANTTLQDGGVQQFAGGLPAVRRAKASPSNSGNQILSAISKSWLFTPSIPHGSGFSATLSLDYSSVTLPDDPNFSESKLQMISVDSAGALHVYQTTIDLTNHIAKASVDGLDPYVSLAVVGQSVQTPVMIASAGSGYALINGGSQNANLTVTPFGSSGTGTAAAAPLKPSSQQGTTPGWLQAWSDSPAVAGASWFDNGILYAITPASTPDGGFMFPNVAYDANTSTEIDLANTTTNDADITIGLFGADGTSKGSYQAVLAAKNSMSERLEALFPSIPSGFTGYVSILTDGLLAASGYRWTGTTAASLTAQSLGTSATSLFAPQLGGTGIVSTVHLVNAGSSTATVTLAAYTGSAPQTFQFKLAAGQRYTNTVDAIFGIAPTTVGSLKVTSDVGPLFGDILVSDSSFIPSFAYSVPLVSQTSTSFAFPVANSASHIFVFNPNTSAANVTVTPYSASGAAGAGITVSVAASGRADLPVSTGTYLILNSDQPVTAYATAQGTGGNVGGYPGIPISGTTTNPGGGSAPTITSGGIVNAASFTTKLGRGSLATIFGSNLSTSTAQAQSLPLLTNLGGAVVTVGGITAPLVYVSPTQINFQVPFEIPDGLTNIVVTAGGTPSAAIPVTVADYAVGVFSCGASPCAVHYSTGQLVTSSTPAVPGEVLIIYATGIGKLAASVATGNASPSSPIASSVDPATITLGGTPVQVFFSGLTPGLVGLVQFNIQLPSTLPSGNLPFVVVLPGDSSAPVNLPVQGNGTTAAPILGLSQSSLAFGNVTVGQTKDLQLTVSNSGTATLNVSGAAVSGAGFTLTTAASFTVAAGGSQTMTVHYAPASVGNSPGALTFSSNDPANASVTVNLTGMGVAAATPTISAPSGVNFSSVAQNSAKPANLIVKNTGAAPLNVTGVTTSGVFSLLSPQSFSVSPGSSSTITLQFSPTTAGGQIGSVTIASNDPVHPNLTVPLWGNAYVQANVLTSDSFNRSNATECALGQGDLKFGGTTSYRYLPDWPGSAPVGASISSGVLANNGLNWGGVQLTTSSDTCNTARGAALPQDLDMVVDVYVPMTGSKITDGGPYFRSRAAAPGDGLAGGTSSGYWVEVFSTGQVVVNQLNPFGVIAQTAIPASFDSTLVHTLGAHVQGTSLQVTLDGQSQTFTQNGASTTTVTVSTASNNGTAGISFGAQMNPGQAGGQTASNLVISSVGSAAAPVISVPNAPVQLGSVTVGNPANVPFNISNIGTAPLIVSGFSTPTDPTVTVTTATPFTVPPGGIAPVNLKFTPTSAGTAVSGSFTITSNDTLHSPTPVSFIGTSALSLAFGNVPVGQISTMTFNVPNTGTAPITVSSVAISNGVFGLMAPAIPFTAQPGSTTPLTVVFAPQTAGAQSAVFTVTSNDPAHPVVVVSLTGTGTGSVSNFLAYSNVVVGQSEMGTLTFTNTGTTPLTVTSQTTSNAAFTVASPTTPYNIPPGQAATITIVFKPAAYTLYNATFSMVTNSGTFTTSLSGAGVAVQ